MEYITSTLGNLMDQTAFFNLTVGNYVMILVACVFLYLAIAKGFEPLLLVPIAFGMLLVNIYPDIMMSIEESSNGVGGLLHYFYLLDEWAILPSLIFMGVGAMTDFGPLIANPKSFLLGAAAQFGIFAAYLGAMAMGFSDKAAAAISIIGGADGPTSIFLAGKLQQTAILGPIAVAAYSYMSLVPIIQPPIMKLLTTEKERKIKMEQLRPVSKLEKILFPIIITIVVSLILPTTAPLVGMLMLGNLFKESGVVRQLTETASNALMYIVVILLGTSVGATTSAEAFLNLDTIKIVVLGLVAFAFGTAAGVLFGKLMCKLSGGKVNPLIGSAGVSAVPMAARVSQKEGAKADPANFLLMHAMGPNVAGVIGTADKAEETPEPVGVGQEDVADLQLVHLERAFGPDGDLGGIHAHPLPGAAVHAFDADGGDGALHLGVRGRAADADRPVDDLFRDDGDHEFTFGYLLPVQQTLEHSGVHGHRTGGEALHRAGHRVPRYQRLLDEITPRGAGEQGRVPRGGQDAVPQEGHAGQDEAGAERQGDLFQDRVIRALVRDVDVAEFQGEAQGIDVHRFHAADGGIRIGRAQGIPDGLFHQRLAGEQSPHDGEDTDDECGQQAFRCFRHGSVPWAKGWMAPVRVGLFSK